MTIFTKQRCLRIILFLMAGSVWQIVIAEQLGGSSRASNSAVAASINASSVEPQQKSQLEQQTSFLSGFNPKRPTVVLQLGGFYATQGHPQYININSLIGDYFTVNHQGAINFLLGLGYYFNGLERDKFSLLYGLNAFYLAPTSVQGKVIQEQLFTKLSYIYYLTQYPIYLASKVLINMNSDKYSLSCDFGIGPNIIKTSDFSEQALDGGMTLPDNAFTGQTKLAFSATVGVGIKFNKVLGHSPLEVGYRFYYLGQGSLSKSNNQILNTLNTGNNYANALIFSIYA